MPSLKITPTLLNRVKNNRLLSCRKVYYPIHRLGTLLKSHASSPDPPIGRTSAIQSPIYNFWLRHTSDRVPQSV